jgi:hypothetical protein
LVGRYRGHRVHAILHGHSWPYFFILIDQKHKYDMDNYSRNADTLFFELLNYWKNSLTTSFIRQSQSVSRWEGVLKIELLVFQLSGCVVCKKLQLVVENYWVRVAGQVSIFWVDEMTIRPDFAYNARPRVFPTVIAYKNGVPRLGWEGFAVMAPEEIQDAMVLDVLLQAAALADEPDDPIAVATSAKSGPTA